MTRLTENRTLLARPMAIALLCAILAASCSERERPLGQKRSPATRDTRRLRVSALRSLGEHETQSRKGAEGTGDFALEALKVKKALGENFIVEVAKPFIVAGNISRADFDRIVNHTILDSYRAFYKQLFTVRPTYIIKVFLFKNDTTYRQYARTLFGDEPTTPFGYYKSAGHSLVMNIATGTGTLVHEMTHALIEADFPQVPAWFNEGLGSLFEQCIVTPRGLRGLVNWRLPILRKAIREKKLTGLRKLPSTPSSQFYRDERGAHYAEARYFCMYMQELGLLEKFYKSFRANFKQDPSGGKTIEKLFGKSLEQIQQDCLEWVEKLPTPP